MLTTPTPPTQNQNFQISQATRIEFHHLNIKKTSNRDNFCIRDSNKTSFGALEFPVKSCNQESLLF